MDAIKTLLTGTGGLLRVRAILAFGWSLGTLYLFTNGDAVPVEMLVINTGIVANYFGTRGAS